MSAQCFDVRCQPVAYFRDKKLIALAPPDLLVGWGGDPSWEGAPPKNLTHLGAFLAYTHLYF